MTLQLDFATTLVDEWVRCGLAHAVMAPGSRSSPLAVALLREQRLTTHVRLDERSAAFFALGTALHSGRPAVVLTTSGTAAAEVHACVLEADLANVPLIVCTADRPPELHGVGAPQTVEQVGLFSGALRYFADPGVPDLAGRLHWRSLAARAYSEASAGPRGPGPVHLNLAFREPLLDAAGELPPPAPGGGPWHEVRRAPGVASEVLERFLALCAGTTRGVIVAGGGTVGGGDGTALRALGETCGWPLLSDGRAVPREAHPVVVSHADAILRSAAVKAHLRPELVVHLGSPHASKVLATWTAELAEAGVPGVLVDPFGSFEDPDRRVATVLGADPATLCALAAARLSSAASREASWLSAWRAADDAAAGAISARLSGEEVLSEPGVAYRVVGAAEPGAVIVASSSMPVRDLEWFATARPGAPLVLSNRGANGIDGVTSTVLGVAASVQRATPGRQVIGLLGDLAFFHDLSGLVWGAAEVVPDATLIVVDNHGGGIFSFLSYPDEIDAAVFERAFGTPQSPRVAAVAAALGWHVDEVEEPATLDKALVEARLRRGISVVVVATEREQNVAAHTALNAALSAAVEGALGISRWGDRLS